MSNPDLGTLQMVDVRKVWNHEERDFTPWLADNLLRLNAALNMNLELVAIEDWKPEAGRADILAKDTGSGANIVIENQLGWSDDATLPGSSATPPAVMRKLLSGYRLDSGSGISTYWIGWASRALRYMG